MCNDSHTCSIFSDHATTVLNIYIQLIPNKSRCMHLLRLDLKVQLCMRKMQSLSRTGQMKSCRKMVGRPLVENIEIIKLLH